MKTTDLIPILLYHLKDGDKYGLELVNACEECSDGNIKIKQPTLYSILKKLEKSRFITSYWKDSDIGGKRHYYKITDNGLAQLDTYPPLQDLVSQLAYSTPDLIESVDIEEPKFVNKKSENSPFNNIEFDKKEDSNSSELKSFNPFDNFTLGDTSVSLSLTDSADSKSSPISQIESENSFVEDDEIIESPINDDLIEEAIVGGTDYLLSNEDSASYIYSNQDINENVFEQYVENYSEDSSVQNANPSFNDTNDNISTNNVNESILTEKMEEIMPVSPTSTNSFDIFDALSFSDENNNNNERQTQETNNINNIQTYQDLEDEFVDIKINASEYENINQNSINIADSNSLRFELNNPFNNTMEEANLENIEEQNEENIKLIAEDKNEEFATDKKVVKFTQKSKIRPAKIQYRSSLNEIFDNKEELEKRVEPVENYMNVEHKDYVDFKTDRAVIYANKLKKQKVAKNITSILICLIAIALNVYLAIQYSEITPLFCVCHGVVMLYILFYSCNLIGRYKTLTYQFLTKVKPFDFKKRLIVRLLTIIVFVIAIYFINQWLVNGSIFKLNNFANFYANIILSGLLVIDYILALLFYRKSK